jgi:hypothetical protein
MSYDPYKNTDSWDLMAQVALWRERAIHQAERAERFKALAEACRTGTPLIKEPK